MNTLLKTVGCLALAAMTAPALEKELVDRIVQSAQSIERDAQAVSSALRGKALDASAVSGKLDSMSSDLTQLHQLVETIESQNNALSERDRADWQRVKEKVKLLEIFHERKKELAADNLVKHRKTIRAHAEGVALRARKLQETAATLRRG